jgi:hypothetical protein
MARRPMAFQASTREPSTLPRFSDRVTGDMSSALIPSAFAFMVSW